VGLINDVPTVKELIDRTMAEAESLIRQRLTGLLDGVPEQKLHKKARAVA
jgi:nitronate monooxygenase